MIVRYIRYTLSTQNRKQLIRIIRPHKGEPGRVVKVKQLATCVSKFAHQRQTLSELQVGANTAVAASRFASNARAKVAQKKGMPLTSGGSLAGLTGAIGVS